MENKIYEENIRTLKILFNRILNEHNELYDQGKKKKDIEIKFLKEKTDGYNGLLIGSSIPAAITTVETVVGAIGLFTPMKDESYRLFCSNGINTLINLSLPVGVYLLGKVSGKICKTSEFDGLYFTDENAKKLYESNRTLCMIQGLVNSDNDPALSTAKDFLSNVYIAGNSIKFNKGFIALLADHWETIKYEQDHGMKPVKSEEALDDLACYIENNIDTADEFKDNLYINFFLRNRHPDKYKSEQRTNGKVYSKKVR